MSPSFFKPFLAFWHDKHPGSSVLALLLESTVSPKGADCLWCWVAFKRPGPGPWVTRSSRTGLRPGGDPGFINGAQVPWDLLMGWLRPGLALPVSCLILVWAAGSGSSKVLHKPACLSDYVDTITCEWRMAGPTNCSAELHMVYQLDSVDTENRTCVPKNRDSSACVCEMPLNEVLVNEDVFWLQLRAGERLLWRGPFTPSQHIKPRAPGDLVVSANSSNTWLLMWSNPYATGDFLHNELTYLVNISNENNPTDFVIYNVTYQNPELRIAASTLRSGVSYRARVKAWVQSYNSTWSEWSNSVVWQNNYQLPLEQRLPIGVTLSCIIIGVLCFSCYCSISKIKKEWWDQIPNPAHSPLMAIIIQDSQVPLWGRRTRGQEPANYPRWKTCLNKLLPCLLEHGKEKNEEPPKAAREGPFQGPGKTAWSSAEGNKMVLWAENITVVQCVELLEAPAESEEEEEVEEDKGSFCPSPEDTGGSLQEGREGIAARLAESLFLGLLGTEDGDLCSHSSGESFLCPPSENQGREQPFEPAPCPLASLTQCSSTLAFTEAPAVVADNPAYRSFSDFLSQSPGPRQPDSEPPLAQAPCAPQPSELPASHQPELETWEQILRRSVLQHGVATAPATAPAGGYRELECALKQGGAQEGRAAGFGPSGETGYKAFSSLLPGSAACLGVCRGEASSGEGAYRPFQKLDPGCPGAPAPVPAPQFTVWLGTEPPYSPQPTLLPGSPPECPGLEPGEKGEDSQKPPPSAEQAADPLGDDLGGSIVYSALTCHLCGHLKQCHGQEEHGEAPVAGPCCGCCCGDRASPLVSPLRAPGPRLGAAPWQPGLSPASLAPLGVSEEMKLPPSFHPPPNTVQSSDQTPKLVAVACTGLACTSVS
nr:interleukin-4 receptor subunit alpha isoform X1 [Dasypus novemcinctus]